VDSSELPPWSRVEGGHCDLDAEVSLYRGRLETSILKREIGNINIEDS